MGGEIIEAVPFEISERFESLALHELQQFLTQLFDHGITKFHHSCANLNGIATEQDELRSIATRFHPANGRERAPGEFFANHLGDLHDHAQSDGLHSLAGIPTRR